MQTVAKLNNCPSSPRKMRLVVDLIRGKSCEESLNILKYCRKDCARKLEKLLLSNISNWQRTYPEFKLEDMDLFIKTAFVDGGRMLKRGRPAPHGRVHRIRKRSNHVTIIIENRKGIAAENVATPEKQLKAGVKDEKILDEKSENLTIPQENQNK